MAKTEKQKTGKWGEEVAMRYLRERGFEIKDLNWTFQHLEIDIVAMDKDELVIIEVKTRVRMRLGNPKCLSIKRSKQN